MLYHYQSFRVLGFHQVREVPTYFLVKNTIDQFPDDIWFTTSDLTNSDLILHCNGMNQIPMADIIASLFDIIDKELCFSSIMLDYHSYSSIYIQRNLHEFEVNISQTLLDGSTICVTVTKATIKKTIQTWEKLIEDIEEQEKNSLLSLATNL